MKVEKCILTPEGFVALEQELLELKTVKRPEIIEALKEARAHGDLSENADYDSAREDQAKLESKIKELEYKLENCEIVNRKAKKDKVGLGSVVTIEYDDKDTETYTLVGSVESDLLNNKISIESPLGSAIFGKKISDVVEVNSPNGIFTVKIIKLD